MSHEIRTPMNAIIGLTHLLLRQGPSRGAGATRLAKVEVAGRHLLALINDVLDLSKIEAGRLRAGRRRLPCRQPCSTTCCPSWVSKPGPMDLELVVALDPDIATPGCGATPCACARRC